jgi:putative intracellular protease/amidase
MDVTVFVFNGMASSDVSAPVAALAESVDVALRLVGIEHGTYHGFEPLREFRTDATTDEIAPTDLLIVPGGLGSVQMMENRRVIDWLIDQVEVSRYVMSVSTGSLLLAAAGLLGDADASGHWLAREFMTQAGAHPADEPVTWWGKFVTTSGPLAAAGVAAELPERIRFGPEPERFSG